MENKTSPAYTTQQLRDLLALWSITGIGSMNSRKLIAFAGCASNVFKLKKKELLTISGIGEQLATSITSKNHYQTADAELDFAHKYKIKITTIFDADYPVRLKQCDDAPLIIFSKGQPLNNNYKYISLVGTRKATNRGIEFCNTIINNLYQNKHNIAVISGLAFGIDIAAHKAALNCNVPTYAVLAHGLDTIYPAAHRDTALKMLEHGGLITEFFKGAFPDKNNFVRRNRIIAGLSDAVIVVESDVKGGSLITADLANSYNREVFAVPGRLADKYSTGCNMLIKTNRAALIQSAADIEYIMGWQANEKAVQKQLFVELTPDETIIDQILNTDQEMPIDEICRCSQMPVSKVSAILLQMEFKGVVKCLPGKLFSKM